AQDVKHSFEMHGKPYVLWPDIVGSRVLDAHTIEFTAKSLNYETLRNILTMLRIVPKQDLKTVAHDELTGTGPFKVARFEPGRRLELEPFKAWWGGRESAANFKLVVKNVADTLAAEQMFQKNELDFFQLPADYAKSDGPATPLTLATGQGIWIDLNLSRPIFRDPRVRQALIQLWDLESGNQKIFAGRWELAIDTFSPATSYYPPGSPLAFNTTKANETFVELGWLDRDKDGVREKSIDGKLEKFSFTLLLNSQAGERWATLFKADAAKLGVEVKLKRVDDPARWWQIVRSSQYDALASGGPVQDEVYEASWGSKGQYNSAKFKNPEVDRLIAKLQKEYDGDRRANLFRQIIQIIRAEYPQLTGLFSRQRFFLISARLKVDPESPSQPWKWRLKN
ncbi:MAG TPA: ABC transporter substrate-binding protein, partial [Bdellovibrionales bacterium]|nr:ABC transporter substrate-binding protein [Bdellovibrionales bacterium]